MPCFILGSNPFQLTRARALETMKDSIHTEEYKGYTINVYPDQDVYDGPLAWGNGEIFACTDRDLYITGEKDEFKGYAPGNISFGELYALLATHRVYLGSFGSHSGVWLKGYTEVTREQTDKAFEPLKAEHKECCVRLPYGNDALYENVHNTSELFDNSPILFAYPREKGATEEESQARAHGFWETMDEWIRGEVYGYDAISPEGESVGSVWGYYGDYNDSGLMGSAKEDIDNAIEEKRKSHIKRTKELVRNRVPLLSR